MNQADMDELSLSNMNQTGTGLLSMDERDMNKQSTNLSDTSQLSMKQPLPSKPGMNQAYKSQADTNQQDMKQPVPSQPHVNELAMDQSGMSLLDTNQPGMQTKQLGMGQVNFPQSNMWQPDMNKLAPGQQGKRQSGMWQARQSQPGIHQLDLSQLDTRQWGTRQPGTSNLGTRQRSTSYWGMRQPSTSEWGMEQPGNRYWDMMQPDRSQPSLSQPGPNQLGRSQPGPSHPWPSLPGRSQPGPNHPWPSLQGRSHPGPSQPRPSQSGRSPLGVSQPGVKQSTTKQSSRPPFHIRPAEAEDCPEILHLIKELAACENMLDAVKITAMDLLRDGFGNNPLFYCLIAEVDNGHEESGTMTVGFAMYYFTYDPWIGKLLYLEDFYVTHAYRGIGIGAEMLKRLSQIAILSKCNCMHFLVVIWNQASIDYYTRRGALDLSSEEGWHLFRFNREELMYMAWGRMKEAS